MHLQQHQYRCSAKRMHSAHKLHTHLRAIFASPSPLRVVVVYKTGTRTNTALRVDSRFVGGRNAQRAKESSTQHTKKELQFCREFYRLLCALRIALRTPASCECIHRIHTHTQTKTRSAQTRPTRPDTRGDDDDGTSHVGVILVVCRTPYAVMCGAAAVVVAPRRSHHYNLHRHTTETQFSQTFIQHTGVLLCVCCSCTVSEISTM